MPNFAANISMMFREFEFFDRFSQAADSGFTAVEYLFPYPHQTNELAYALKQNRLKQVLFNLPAGDFANGERGIACLPGREQEFRHGIEQAIEYAQILACPRVNCLAGIPPDDVDADEIEALLIENLRFAAQTLEKAGIELMVEMLNTVDVPGFVLNHSAQAVNLLKKIAQPNLKIQYDIYHMQIMEGNICPTIKSLLSHIGHIQLADNPGRHEPGTGEIHYPFIFNWLDKIGYAGWVGCEYIPRTKTNESLDWFKNCQFSE